MAVFVLLIVASAALLTGLSNRYAADIERNQRWLAQRALQQVLQSEDYRALGLDHRGGRIYQLAKHQSSVASLRANNGYNGAITFLVAYEADRIGPIAIVTHSETPGLGDRIEAAKSPWSAQFDGLSLAQAPFKLRVHGGDIDALSGATISTLAIVSAINRFAARSEGQEADAQQ